MTNTTQPITFPEGLASKILWSPHIDHVSGRNSRASYVLVTSDSQSRLAPPSAEDLTPSSKEVSITETKISDASMEPVSPVAGELNAGLDDATEPIINNIVTADNSSSNGEETQTQDDLTIPNLPDSIQNEINARVSYKFTADVQMEAIKAHKTFLAEKKPIVEPVVHLYCPHGGCHEIIDKAVRTIAKHEGAEILTLDAFELSSAGIYGDQFYEALSASYRHPIIPNEIVENKASSNSDTDKDSSGCSSIEESAKECRKEGTEQCGEADKGKQEEEIQIQTRKDEELKKLDSGVQAIFDSLISISSCQNLQDSAASTKKRIIYIRDFGSIAKVAAAFIVRLLCAIHARRTAKFSDGVKSEDLIQPTILILGYSNTTNDISESVFVRGGETLRKALPSIGAECLREDLTSITLSPIASRFFLGSLVVEGENKSSHSYDSDDDHLSIVLKLSLFKLLSDMAMPKSMTSVTTSSASSSLKELKCSVFNGPTFSLDSFDLSSASLAMSIFFKGPEKEAFTALEKSLCDRRMTSMANAWFRISLAQRRRRLACDDVIAFLGDDEDLQKDLVLEEKKKKRGQGKKDLEKPKEHSPYKGRDLLARLAQLTDSSISVTLDQAVAIALGLGNPGQTSELDIPEVPFSAFSKAFRILIHNHKSRTEWRNEQSELEEEDDDSEDRDDEDEDPVVKAVKNADNLTQHESQMLSCIVNPNELTTSFEDICIPEKIVDTLRTIISLRLKFPSAFASGVLGRESMGGVLLYGPPGTGKTMVCRAVASECGARMLVIKPSDIMDKHVGESEKLVKAIFTLAYRLSPCLIFIDELDSFFGKRKDDDKKWVRDMLSEFLQSMDGLKSAKKNKDAGVVLIGATNRPQDIDEAVIRRLPSRMMLDAPDEKQRKRILELHLRGEALDDDVRLHEIAVKTTNYSGSDLKNVCVSAAMTSVKEAVGTFRWTPMKSKDVPKVGDKSTFGGAAGDEETENAKAKIDKRTVKMKHLLAALDEVPGSLTNNTTGQSELHRWHTQYGAGASSRPNHGAGIGRFGGYTGASSKTGAGSYSSVGDSTGAGGHGLGGGGAGAGKYDLGGGAGAGGYGLGRNATGAGGYGLGGNTSSAGGHGLGGNTTGAGGYGIGANRFGAGSGSGYGVGGSSIFGSGTGGNGHNSGIANSNAAGAALDANASSSSPLNIPRYPYGRNPGASGGYGSNSNTPASGAEPNPSGENFNPGQLPGRYHEYGALNGNGSSGILGGDGTTSGLPRYGGLFGGGIGGGIGSGGPNSFGAGGLGIVGAGGVLGGLGSVHGMGGFGSAGDNGHGPHASIEQVDEQS